MWVIKSGCVCFFLVFLSGCGQGMNPLLPPLFPWDSFQHRNQNQSSPLSPSPFLLSLHRLWFLSSIPSPRSYCQESNYIRWQGTQSNAVALCLFPFSYVFWPWGEEAGCPPPLSFGSRCDLLLCFMVVPHGSSYGPPGFQAFLAVPHQTVALFTLFYHRCHFYPTCSRWPLNGN